MLRLIDKGTDWRIEAETTGVSVYLDNHSIIDLALYKPALGRRFLDALHRSGTLLFSLTNVVEITGPQGKSSEAVGRFLSAIGPHWVPVDLDPSAVMRREEQGHPAPPFSTEFAKTYVEQREADLRASGQKLNTSDPTLFDLAKLVDWTTDHRDEIRADAAEMDTTLGAKLKELRTAYDAGNRAIDAHEQDPLTPGGRATYVFWQLTRMMIREAKSYGFKAHDALDLCHAVVGIGYSTLATLDKNWKRRADAMPHRNQLARVYYARQLEQFVSDFETAEMT